MGSLGDVKVMPWDFFAGTSALIRRDRRQLAHSLSSASEYKSGRQPSINQEEGHLSEPNYAGTLTQTSDSRTVGHECSSA